MSEQIKQEVTTTVVIDGDQIVINMTIPGKLPEWLLAMSYEEALDLGNELVRAAEGVME